MTRSSFQRGFVSNPIRTRSGIVFEIRYRVRSGNGTWKHKSERLHGLEGKKQLVQSSNKNSGKHQSRLFPQKT